MKDLEHRSSLFSNFLSERRHIALADEVRQAEEELLRTPLFNKKTLRADAIYDGGFAGHDFLNAENRFVFAHYWMDP
jgi:hypothetical protein